MAESSTSIGIKCFICTSRSTCPCTGDGEFDVGEREVETDPGVSGVQWKLQKPPGMLMHVLKQFCCQIAPLARLGSLGAVKF